MLRLAFTDTRREQQTHRKLQRAETTDDTMRFNTLFFLLILSCLCLALTQTTYEDCCFKYVKKMNHRTQRQVVTYRLQETDGGCNIPAVVFTMKKGLDLCADPKKTWVKELQRKVDAGGIVRRRVKKPRRS